MRKPGPAPDSLAAKVEALPRAPGIYFFKDARGEIVYIGKAVSLQDRVKSYFQPTSDPKVRAILRETADVDYLLTDSEKDAVFLESNYIRNVQPRFNLRLKDDKSFPYLKLTVGDEAPGIYFTRKVAEDGARYFGPFAPPGRARRTIHVINKYFGVRGCEEKIPGRRTRPCLDYELGLCAAPCVAATTPEDYRERVRNALLLLEGRTGELKSILTAKMEEAAGGEDFEQAAWWRDALGAVEDVKTGSRIISPELRDLDIIGFGRAGGVAAVMVFLMRKGKVLESKPFLIDAPLERASAEVLGSFLARHYGNARPDVEEILVPFEPPAAGELRLPLLVPKRGRKKQLLAFAERNALLLLKERTAPGSGLEELGGLLGVRHPVRRIEGFDVSNTGGTESVGSLVVFVDGRPRRSDYRKFKIKTVEGPNDVAGLSEVIARRYRRSLAERTPLPDLVFVDGGKPQLGAALRTLREMGLVGIPVVGLAKKEEIIFREGDKYGIRLERSSEALKLLQRIRDEAHRFAITFHRARREKRSLS